LYLLVRIFRFKSARNNNTAC